MYRIDINDRIENRFDMIIGIDFFCIFFFLYYFNCFIGGFINGFIYGFSSYFLPLFPFKPYPFKNLFVSLSDISIIIIFNQNSIQRKKEMFPYHSKTTTKTTKSKTTKSNKKKLIPLNAIYYRSIVTYINELQDLQRFSLITKRCQQLLQSLPKTYIYNSNEKISKRVELFGNALEIQCHCRVLPKLLKEIPKKDIQVKLIFETDEDYSALQYAFQDRIDVLEIHFLHVNPKYFGKMIELLFLQRNISKVTMQHSVLLSMYKSNSTIKEWFSDYDCQWKIIITKDCTSSQLSLLFSLFSSLHKYATILFSISTLSSSLLQLLFKQCDKNDHMKIVSYSPQYLDLILNGKIVYLWNTHLSRNYSLPSSMTQQQSKTLNKLYYPAFRIDSSIKSLPSVDYLSYKISLSSQLQSLKSFPQIKTLELIIDSSSMIKSIDLKQLENIQSLKIVSIKGIDKNTTFFFPSKLISLCCVNCLFTFQQLRNLTTLNSLTTLILIDNSIPSMSLPTNITYFVIENNKQRILITNKQNLKYLK